MSDSRSELLARRQALDQKLLGLLEQLRNTLPAATYEFALETTDAHEYGVALHAICDHFQLNGVPMPPTIYEQVEAVGRMMEMPEETWASLRIEPNP